MSIIRSPRPESNFYILDKRISEDPRLSWAARGALIFLLGKPDHWKVNIEALVNATGDSCRPAGKTAVYAIISELLDSGYMTRQKHADGKLDYYVHETAQNENEPDSGNLKEAQKPDSGNPNQGNPNLGNPPLVSTDSKKGLKKAVRTENAAEPLVLPEWLDVELWSEWVTYRKKKNRTSVTDHAMRLWLRDLGNLNAEGHNLRKIVEKSIASGWSGLFAPQNHTKTGAIANQTGLDGMDYTKDFF